MTTETHPHPVDGTRSPVFEGQNGARATLPVTVLDSILAWAENLIGRARSRTMRPTVIRAGESKLSDARAPLVIATTEEQTHAILEFTRKARRD